MALLQQFKQFFGIGQTSIEKKSLFEQVLISLRRGGIQSRNISKTLEYYAAHELVYACVNKIADVMNDAELVVERKNRKGEWEIVEGHPLVSLLNKPNANDIGEDFGRLRVQSEYVTGIAYFEKIYSRAKLLVALEPILPTTITPKLNYNQTEIEYYQIQTGGKQYNLSVDRVLIRRRADLTNLFFGLAPAQVAMKSINADLGLSDYVEAFFNSDGTPSGILKILNKNLTETEIEKTQSKWKSRYGRNGSNQKGVAVLDQNADFQKIGSNLNELDSGNLSDRHESKICSVFGVPPILVGALVGLKYTTANATAKSALQDFVTNKISPELKSYRKWLTWNLLSEFEKIEDIKAGNIRVNFDLSQVSYLQEDLDKVQDRARKNFAVGAITQNEFRAEIKMLPAKDGDKYVWELRQSQNQQQLTEPKEDAKEEQPKKLQLKAGSITHEFSSTQIDLVGKDKKTILAFGENFISEDDLADELDWDSREDKPHITVKFGLHADNADELKSLLADIAPFEVILRKTSIFAGKEGTNYDVVKIDVESEDLHAINKLISDNLDCTDTHPKYIPHLTLAYVKKGEGKKYIGDSTFDGQIIAFDKITFSDKKRNKIFIKLTGAKSEKKTFDLDGIILARAPKGIENQINLKKMVTDLESESAKVNKILLKFREILINEAVKLSENFDEATIYQLTLSPNAKTISQLNKAFASAYNVGREQVIDDINAQLSDAKNITILEQKDLDKDILQKISEITNLTIAKLINEIQKRAVDVFILLKALGIDASDLISQLKEKLDGESTKWLDERAGNSTNSIIQNGRADEIENQKDIVKFVEYSAILDKNTCSPCGKADGETANDAKELPKVPNPDCLGGERCRCFHIGIVV